MKMFSDMSWKGHFGPNPTAKIGKVLEVEKEKEKKCVGRG